MTTRRQVLMLAAGSGLLAACDTTSTGGASTGTRLKILALHQDGIGVLDLGSGGWMIPPAPAAVPPDHRGLASMRGNELAIWRLPQGQRASAADLDGPWTPRAMQGLRVALVQGAHDTAIYEPVGRSTTRIMVTGTEKSFDLPGNLEPEAFSPDGGRLYLLDYLPPRAPDLYRVRMLDIATGQIFPLATRDKKRIPEGAEETMRGQGRHAVYDPSSGLLFTLYTHQPDHQHTGELLGVRPGSPDVHAFIHALQLAEGWAVCIDLPKPFGQAEAQGHALALSHGGNILYAVSAAHGAVAEIDRDALTTNRTSQFNPMQGKAFALSTMDGRLMIAAGRQLTDTKATWSLPADLNGLAESPDGMLWTCLSGRIGGLDWSRQNVVHDIAVPGVESVLGVV